jgi:hypothetical protein
MSMLPIDLERVLLPLQRASSAQLALGVAGAVAVLFTGLWFYLWPYREWTLSFRNVDGELPSHEQHPDVQHPSSLCSFVIQRLHHPSPPVEASSLSSMECHTPLGDR